jgi:predicted transcriptional regulator of viral defense system
MYDTKLLNLVKKMPVFSLADVAKLTNNRNYAKVLLARMVKEKTIFKIMKNKYSLYDNPLIFSPFLHYPSYISCASALSYYGLITQIPNSIFLMTTKRPKIINKNIIFHKTKNFFGFKTIKINNIITLMAEPEKAFIDSIGIHPMNLILEALPELDEKKLFDYAKKCGQTKRIAFLLKKSVKVSNKYIYLDPIGKKRGGKDTKWKLIVNC